MSCLNPTQAWQDLLVTTKSGRNPVIFRYKDLEPHSYKWRYDDETGTLDFVSSRYRPLALPCGKCLLCRKSRSWEVAVRALLEWQADPLQKACFITLTVDDAHMPEVFPGLLLRHRPWQLFAKRLRKVIGPFRFVMCGEYGEHTRRPHYHAIIYGHDLTQRTWNFSDGTFCDSPLLAEIWHYGHVNCRPVEKNAIMYVSGYQLKLDDAEVEGDLVVDSDVKYKNYVKWSRMPGLGMPFLLKYPNLFRETDYKFDDGFTCKTMSPSIVIGRKLSFFNGRYFKKVLERCAIDERMIGKIDESLRLLFAKKFAILQLLERGRVSRECLHGLPYAKEVRMSTLVNREKLLKLHLARKSRDVVA